MVRVRVRVRVRVWVRVRVAQVAVAQVEEVAEERGHGAPEDDAVARHAGGQRSRAVLDVVQQCELPERERAADEHRGRHELVGGQMRGRHARTDLGEVDGGQERQGRGLLPNQRAHLWMRLQDRFPPLPVPL